MKQSRSLKSAEIEAISAGFPADLRIVCRQILTGASTLTPVGAVQSGNTVGLYQLALPEGEVCIPYRVYIDSWPRSAGTLESWVLACILSRHDNGRIRETYVQQLADMDVPPQWAIPYVLLPLSEYVLEVAEIACTIIVQWCDEKRVLDKVAWIAQHNPKLLAAVRARSVSYWNAYWRPDMSLNDTPASRALACLEARLDADLS
jgi:hypothetical protein